MVFQSNIMREMKAPIVAFRLVDSWRLAMGAARATAKAHGEFQFYIVAAIGANGKQVPMRPYHMKMISNASSDWIMFSDQLGASGRRGGAPIGTGKYLVRIEGDFFQPSEQEVSIDLSPEAPAVPLREVELKPNSSYVFERGRGVPDIKGLKLPAVLRGTLQDKAGYPLYQAEISVKNQANLGTTATNIDGDFVLPIPPFLKDLTLQFVVTHAGLNQPYNIPGSTKVVPGLSQTAGTHKIPVAVTEPV